MTNEEIDALLAERGYRGIASPYPNCWRGWLWVEPLREDAQPTMLCRETYGLSPDGLHWLLDHYCELKSCYYTDEQRATTKRTSTKQQSKRAS